MFDGGGGAGAGGLCVSVYFDFAVNIRIFVESVSSSSSKLVFLFYPPCSRVIYVYLGNCRYNCIKCNDATARSVGRHS